MSSTREASGGADPPPPATWSDALASTHHSKYARNLFPPLTPSAHKGSHGRVAILGGSDKYAGAPYYAAQSALHCGVDLATVFTAKEAAVPIKCYSPELMVQSVYSIEELDGLAAEEEGLLAKLEECKQTNDVMTHEVHEREMQRTMEKLEHSEERQQLLVQNELKRDDKMEVLAERLGKMQQIEGELGELRDRQDVAVQRSVDAVTAMFPSLHALCVGPGLGRHPLVFGVAAKVLRRAIESNLTLVLDADALYMLSLREYRPLLEELRGYERCVMTPNAMEMRRLDDALDLDTAGGANSIVVQKGNVDAILQGSQAMHCKEEGGLKRSGGIGDVLAGTLSAFLAWNAILERRDGSMDEGSKQRAFAAWASCCAVKMATKAAYRKKRRAMSAMHVLEEIGGVLEGMEGGLEKRAQQHPAACAGEK